MSRRKARVIKIGSVKIGGNNPIAIQSMTKYKTSDVDKTVGQILTLEKTGCEIVRLAVKDKADACAIFKIKKQAHIPVVADIHFDWQLAIAAIDNGADKIRLNPGNIYREQEIKEVVAAAKQAKIPIRVGLNSGSVKGAGLAVQRMLASAQQYIRILEKYKFSDIVLSLKASSASETIAAYRAISKRLDYPLHLGVTATGLAFEGLIKSSVAIGSLLLDGIGDTIRISLTDLPQEEVRVARVLLKSLNLRNFGPQIISCPTCGRCEVNLVRIVRDLEKRLEVLKLPARSKPLKVAVMGCVVNGPGEAREADLGIAFGKGQGLLFCHGKTLHKVSAGKSVDALINMVKRMV